MGGHGDGARGRIKEGRSLEISVFDCVGVFCSLRLLTTSCVALRKLFHMSCGFLVFALGNLKVFVCR